MDRIPINFEHAGRKYSGYFHQVAGAGGTGVWHLMDHKNVYLGRLRVGANNAWVFDPTPKTESLVPLADYFGDIVTASYE